MASYLSYLTIAGLASSHINLLLAKVCLAPLSLLLKQTAPAVDAVCEVSMWFAFGQGWVSYGQRKIISSMKS